MSWRRRLTPRNENGYDSASSRHKRGWRTGSIDLLLLIRKRTSGGSSSAEEQEGRQARGVESALVANLATLVGLGVVWCEKPILGKTVGWGGRWGSDRTPTTHPPKTKTKTKTKKNQTKPNLWYLLPLICKRKDHQVEGGFFSDRPHSNHAPPKNKTSNKIKFKN